MILNSFAQFIYDNFEGEVLMSLLVMLIIVILAILVNIKFKKIDPTKPTKSTFVLLTSMIVEWLDGMVEDLMGKKWKGFGGYILPLCLYIAFSFFIGLVGLPGPLTYLGNTACISLCTFLWIHGTAVKANKWGYFKRYIDPTPVLLPINLLSMWAPFLSMALRIFGNALSGFTLMTIIYWALTGLNGAIFSFIPGGWGQLVLTPLVTPILHAYFDVFSGGIQTLIFMMLTMILVSNEDMDPELE